MTDVMEFNHINFSYMFLGQNVECDIVLNFTDSLLIND